MNIDDLDNPGKKRMESRKIVLVKDLEDDRTYKKVKKREIVLRIITVAAVLAAVAIAVTVIRTVTYRHTYGTYKTVGRTELLSVDAPEYLAYLDGVIRYGKNGAEYIKADGNIVWNAAYDMKNPAAAVRGGYVVFYDKGNFSFVICSSSGILGECTAAKNIINADISTSGTVCIVTDDESSDYINFYDKDGDALDIEIKTVLAGDGYPMDVSVSPDGQMLMLSYMYLNEGIIQNKVVFYNFSELGQSYSDRLVGVFNSYGESIVPVVKFISNDYACAFSENDVSFYSLKNPVKPALLASYGYDREIKSVFTSDDYIGVISGNTDGTSGNSLDIYMPDGRHIANAQIVFEYDEVKFYNDYVILNNSTYCIIYTVDGHLKYEGKLDGAIDFVTGIKNNRLIRIGDNIISEVKLKH